MTSDFNQHQDRLNNLWKRLVYTLGIHTVNVLLDRAIWEAAQKYPELVHIQYNEHGLSFDGLAEHQQKLTDTAFNTLYEEMMLILARLLGQDMAKRLITELSTERTQDGKDTA